MFDDTHFNFSIFHYSAAEKSNTAIHSQFRELNKIKNIKRSHLFNGRYENIFIDKYLIPELTPTLDFATQCAKKILNLSSNLDVGFWFNDMPPTSITIPHTHDDDDEMLSGAYYVDVPQNSGDLILHNGKNKKVITPKAGQLILFKPDCLHEVSINNSPQHRLSIGMNFGIRTR